MFVTFILLIITCRRLHFERGKTVFILFFSSSVARKRYTTSIELNHPYFPSCPTQAASYQELPLCQTGSCMDAILTHSSQRSVVIYPPYSHNFHFLPYSLSFVSLTSFRNLLLVTFESYLV